MQDHSAVRPASCRIHDKHSLPSICCLSLDARLFGFLCLFQRLPGNIYRFPDSLEVENRNEKLRVRRKDFPFGTLWQEVLSYDVAGSKCEIGVEVVMISYVYFTRELCYEATRLPVLLSPSEAT